MTEGNAVPSRDLLLAELPDAVFLEKDGVIIFASDSIMRVLGYPPETIVGMSLESLSHPDEVSSLVPVRARLAAGEEVTVLIYARHAHGHHIPVEARLRPHQDAATGSDVIGLLRPLDDTSDRREDIARVEAAPGLLANRAGDVLFLVDGEGIVLEAGPGVHALLGWTADELQGIPLAGLLHPDDQSAATAYRASVQADTATGSIEVRARTRGGSWRWFLATGVMVSAPEAGGREARRVMVSWRDIDALVRDARFAEREAARLRAIIDVALDPWLMLGPLRDRRGHITDFVVEDANAGAAEYLRWPRDQLVGARLAEEFPALVENGLLPAYVEAMESGGPVVVHDLAYPHEIHGGTRRYEVRARSAGGSLMLTWRDTTPVSLARDELAKAESLFRAIASVAGDAVVFVRDGSVAWASQGAQDMGFAADADFASVLEAVVVPDSAGDARTCALLMESHPGYAGRLHRADGTPMIVRAHPINGTGAGSVVVITDEVWTTGG